VARALLTEQRLYGLVLGSDYEDNTRHSDTIMFVSYDPKAGFSMICLSRVTHISRCRARQESVASNEVFAYEFKRSGKNFEYRFPGDQSTIQTLLSQRKL